MRAYSGTVVSWRRATLRLIGVSGAIAAIEWLLILTHNLAGSTPWPFAIVILWGVTELVALGVPRGPRGLAGSATIVSVFAVWAIMNSFGAGQWAFLLDAILLPSLGMALARHICERSRQAQEHSQQEPKLPLAGTGRPGGVRRQVERAARRNDFQRATVDLITSHFRRRA
jgi:hypothetical protein